MTIYRTFNNIMLRTLGVMLLAHFMFGCKDTAYYINLDRQYCKEFATNGPGYQQGHLLCNGKPILVTLATAGAFGQPDDLEEIVNYLVNNQEDPNAKDSLGQTPLMLAIDASNFKFAQLILPYSNLSEKDNNGKTYMHHAATARIVGLDNNFLDAATAVIPDKLGELPIETALKAKNYDYVWAIMLLLGRNDLFAKLKVEFQADVLFTPNADLRPDFLDAFAPVLNSPFSGRFYDHPPYQLINDVKQYGVIHYAAEHSLPNLVNYLVRRHVSLNGLSSKGTPLALAAQAFTEAKDVTTRARAEKTVELLLDSTEAIEAPGALNALAHTLNAKWVHRVLDADVEMTTADSLFANCHMKSGYPSSSLAELYLYAKCKKLNLDFKISPEVNEIKQNQAHFALYLLAETDYKSLFSSFFSNDFDSVVSHFQNYDLMNAQDDFGMLPIHYWLINSHRAEVSDDLQVRHLKTLLRYTEEPATLTYNRDSVLSLAVKTRNLALVKAVVSQIAHVKALVQTKNKQGFSPLELAIKNGDQKIYEYLASFR